jgi:putative thioredoxin
MAKVNVDENQELAAAMRIQSIPVVYAFFQGRPLDGFQGAMPESQIKAFVEKVVQAARQGAPDALDIPAALNAATQALGHGDLQTAQTIYMQVLQEQEKNAQAYAGLVRTLIAGGALDRAAQMIESAPEEIAKDIHFTQAKTALELAQASPPGAVEELAARVAAKPEDHQARFDLAAAQFAAGQKEAAIDSLLEIISRNRTWKEDEARKQLLKLFDALGPADPLTAAGRRKLSSILFS